MSTLLLLAVFSALVSIRGSDCKIVMFIFGDSLSDAGNNQHLTRSLAKASLPWYGIDFGNGLPNGRFTNGRTVADFMGDAMGLPRPPALLDPKLDEGVILKNGVNYASGGAGILNETGSYFIERLSFQRQIELFSETRANITKKIGKNGSDKFFKKSVYLVAFGSNDFINNYLMPIYRDSWKYDEQDFMDYLIATFRGQLKLLHQLGVRKMMVLGLGPLGCIPLQRVLTKTGDCQDETNILAGKFNNATRKMVGELANTLFPKASFQYADPYDFVHDLISDPRKHGFKNSDAPCCSFGRIRPSLTCIPASELCRVRSEYVFWDEYHPSDSANQIIANELLKQFGLLQNVNHTTNVP